MKKDNCDKCGENKWINKHHIYPREHFGNKENNETVKLCLDCHSDIHSLLPKEKKEKSFYKEFTVKFIAGLSIVVVFICVTKLLGIW